MSLHRPNQGGPKKSKLGDSTQLDDTSPESPDALIRYRTTGIDQLGQAIPTGFSTSCYRARRKNLQKCPIYRIPPEILIEIMRVSEPEDLYLLRQASWIFFSAFLLPDFKWSHTNKIYAASRSTPGLMDLAFEAPTAVRSEVQYDYTALTRSQRDKVEACLRRGKLCRSCLPGSDPRSTGLTASATSGLIRCLVCRRLCDVDGFCVGRVSIIPRCLAHVGKKRICPHQYYSFEGLPVPSSSGGQIRCDACASEHEMGPAERPPTLIRSRCPDGRDRTRLEWKFEILTVDAGQVVTKQLIRQNLEKVDGVLCPHARWNPDLLMAPFDWRRCVCFREPTVTTPICYSHVAKDESCCACQNVSTRDTMGLLMASSQHGCTHQVYCAHCSMRYDWELRGRQLLLGAAQSISKKHSHSCTSSDDTTSFLCPPTDYDACSWISQLDADTYESMRNVGSQKCGDAKCWNRRPYTPDPFKRYMSGVFY